MVIDDAEDALGGENVEHDSCEHENAPGVIFSLSVIRWLWVGVMIQAFPSGERSNTRLTCDRCW